MKEKKTTEEKWTVNRKYQKIYENKIEVKKKEQWHLQPDKHKNIESKTKLLNALGLIAARFVSSESNGNSNYHHRAVK